MRSRDHIKSLTGIAGVVGLLAVTAGCGGGGGGSAPSGGGFAIPNDLKVLKPGVTSAIAPNLSTWTPGDEWYYTIGGNLRTPSNQIVKVHSGYLGLTAGTPTGGDPGVGVPGVLTQTYQRYILFEDNTIATDVIKTFLAPDGAGDKFEIGDTLEGSGNDEYSGNSLCDPSNGFEVIPSAFNASTGFTGSTAFYTPTGKPDPAANNPCVLGGSNLTNQEQTSFTALDQETVTVPAGTFQVWKVRSTFVYVTQGITDVQVAYWAPQIGGYVRMDSERDGKNGHESYTYQLIGFKNQSTITQTPLVARS